MLSFLPYEYLSVCDPGSWPGCGEACVGGKGFAGCAGRNVRFVMVEPDADCPRLVLLISIRIWLATSMDMPQKSGTKCTQ